MLVMGLAVMAGCQQSRQVPFQPPFARPLASADSPVVPSGVVLAGGPLTPDPGLRPPKQVLALSSGGLYGAYSAGFLCGWTKTGTRPEFDVVTGVSTGALAAPFAFLGTEFDSRLQQLYTGVRAEDVFRVRNWMTIPFSDAVASSAPLRDLIDSQINQALMDRLAAEHRKGRRLYIGTTNLDTRRLVIWDMGAIASLPSPDGCRLFRDVILASCSVPGMLPPVMFNVEVDGRPATEMHADGGVASQIFVPSHIFRAAAERMPTGTPVVPGATGNLYAVVAGKLFPDAAPVKGRRAADPRRHDPDAHVRPLPLGTHEPLRTVADVRYALSPGRAQSGRDCERRNAHQHRPGADDQVVLGRDQGCAGGTVLALRPAGPRPGRR